ncbi:DUF6199 family natural product biosynthesis protein [Aureibacillus halotolerans]|uniref:DUF6199 domain-containing protein n=1 Tax=Aureibacillus halotolerans TaxID=1508390 RepID=A0A4R6TWX7_9BACI|nr:DUF6199 family natural product biosynthesis protein [Aureibacillus halotolerans]TDQ38378.1 hypothetical protein EV213_110125 [Aureibacillus halotolerans]
MIPRRGTIWLIAIFLTVSGVVFFINPKISWTLSNFWRFRGDAEPSEGALTIYRLQGAVYFIAGIVVISRLV